MSSNSEDFAGGYGHINQGSEPYAVAGRLIRSIFASGSAFDEDMPDGAWTPPRNEVMPSFSGERFQGQVQEMKNGQVGWITPWSIMIDEVGNYWLSPSIQVAHKFRGTSRVEISLSKGKYLVKAQDVHIIDNRDAMGSINQAEAESSGHVRLYSSDSPEINSGSTQITFAFNIIQLFENIKKLVG